ncbi:MAG: methyltransferase domain-containing protein [Candidatus Hinthialibacter antarcticus]|nr:methyltransferase domain-containing protein [Candidatus Hinthialibacter antarcticus]
MKDIDLTIDTLSTQAEGIGRVDGKAVFVPFTLPQEAWRVSIIDQKKNYDRALPLQAYGDSLNAHPARVAPSCPYYGECGGCQLQHVSYEQQVEWKRQWLVETFRRVGRIDVECETIAASPPWEYRNKLTLPLRRIDGKVALYYHRVYNPAKHIPVNDCAIAHAKIRAAMQPLSEALDDCQAILPPPDKDGAHQACAVFRMIDGALHVELSDVRIPKALLSNLVFCLITAETSIDVLHYHPETSDPAKVYSRNEVNYVKPKDVFRQINPDVREALYDYVLALPFQSKRSLLDGYCGVGELTRMLTRRFDYVVGVEINADAVEIARDESKDEAENLQFLSQPLEAFVRRNSSGFDAMVLNPPRDGLSKPVRRALAQFGSNDVVMISCHPAAMARDVNVFLDAGYSIQSLQAFDMFPQTYHLEAVIHLQK